MRSHLLSNTLFSQYAKCLLSFTISSHQPLPLSKLSMAAKTTATTSYSTLSPKHNLSLSINHFNKNNVVLGFLPENPIRILTLSVSSSRLAKLAMKVSATSAATPVIDGSKSTFEDVSSSPVIVDVNLGDRSYPIYIGFGLLNQPDFLQSLIKICAATEGSIKIWDLESKSVGCDLKVDLKMESGMAVDGSATETNAGKTKLMLI